MKWKHRNGRFWTRLIHLSKIVLLTIIRYCDLVNILKSILYGFFDKEAEQFIRQTTNSAVQFFPF